MNRVVTIFCRAWIVLAIGINAIAVASLFMKPDSPWAHAWHFALLWTIGGIGAYSWLRRPPIPPAP